MNKELTYNLINNHSQIFSEDFFFECEDGWYDILNNLCREIQKEVSLSGCEQVIATQVKEKFASLRFYHIGGNEAIDEMIRNASKKSQKVCEISGEKGCLYQKYGWYKTLSPYLAKSLGFEKVVNV